MSGSVVRGHALVLVSTLAGITGMGIVFGGAMHGNVHAMMQGTPPLLLGLWWSGRELGRSMMGARALRSSGRSQSEQEDRSGPRKAGKGNQWINPMGRARDER